MILPTPFELDTFRADDRKPNHHFNRFLADSLSQIFYIVKNRVQIGRSLCLVVETNDRTSFEDTP